MKKAPYLLLCICDVFCHYLFLISSWLGAFGKAVHMMVSISGHLHIYYCKIGTLNRHKFRYHGEIELKNDYLNCSFVNLFKYGWWFVQLRLSGFRRKYGRPHRMVIECVSIYLPILKYSKIFFLPYYILCFRKLDILCIFFAIFYISCTPNLFWKVVYYKREEFASTWEQILSLYGRPLFRIMIVLGFNGTSTLVGHFVSSPREKEKSDRR